MSAWTTREVMVAREPRIPPSRRQLPVNLMLEHKLGNTRIFARRSTQPSAAIVVEDLADEVDFFSVGTNDLVQFLLAADRIGGQMPSSYEPLHPAVIRVLAMLATAAPNQGKPISHYAAKSPVTPRLPSS